MTMWGKVTGHKALEDLGSLMLRLNAHSIRTYFLLLRDSVIHPPEIVRNHVTGIFFDNRVYYNTWFLDEVYAIHGIQMIPISPVNELARTPTFVEQEWNDILSKQPLITTKDSNISWLSVLLVNGAIVNPMNSLQRLQNATMDDDLGCLEIQKLGCRFTMAKQKTGKPNLLVFDDAISQIYIKEAIKQAKNTHDIYGVVGAQY
ncbi:hypothetical protein PsorP6_004078 [Peronosclerospora sorghi]|uniref:Uncharacterized protein n=1 Tax=Peronosclerospora sorghi TaxID=230839 RepID=A0ACC0VJD0_9STRA|nr:hypothetical protein PsorP6_004078 [Peronosclerospora sorghi]